MSTDVVLSSSSNAVVTGGTAGGNSTVPALTAMSSLAPGGQVFLTSISSASYPDIASEVQRLSATTDNIIAMLDEFEALKRSKYEVRKRKEQEITMECEKAEKFSRLLNMSVRSIPKGDVQSEYKRTVQALDEKYRVVQQAVAAARVGLKNEALSEETKDPEMDNNSRVMAYGEQVLDEINKSADVSIQILAEAKRTAAETSAKIMGQTDQVLAINKDIVQVDDELARAIVVISRMQRRSATDKILWVVLCLLILGLVVVFVLGGVGIKPNQTPDQFSNSGGSNGLVSGF